MFIVVILWWRGFGGSRVWIIERVNKKNFVYKLYGVLYSNKNNVLNVYINSIDGFFYIIIFSWEKVKDI